MEIDVNNRMYLTMVKYGKRIESTYHFNMAYETEEQFDTYVNKAGDIRVQFCVPYNSSPVLSAIFSCTSIR